MLDSYIKRIVIHQFSPNDTELLLSDRLVSITHELMNISGKNWPKCSRMKPNGVSLRLIIPFLQPLVMICWKRLLPLPSYGRKPLLFQRIKKPMI